MDVQVDPTQLRRAAAEVAAVQDRVQTIIDDLRFALAARGTAWEHGTFGTAFAGGDHGYRAAADELFAGAQNVAATLGSYAAAMSAAAEAFTAADTEPAPRLVTA